MKAGGELRGYTSFIPPQRPLNHLGRHYNTVIAPTGSTSPLFHWSFSST